MNRRFFCTTIPAPGQTVELTDAEAHHVRTVLRGTGGERLTLLDGAGLVAEAELLPTSGARRRAPLVCRILAHRQGPRPTHAVTLCVAPPRPKQMSQLVRQATELGVQAIQPVICTHSVARPAPDAVAGWLDDAREACKQSGNAWLPDIAAPLSFAEAVCRTPPHGYIGWVPSGEEPQLAAAPSSPESLQALWIGPEGGFAPEEIAALRARGLLPLSLGPHILRVETAVVAGLTWYHIASQRP